MTDQEFNAEVARRIGIDEGIKLHEYLDSVGIPTDGEGLNLERPDADALLRKVGSSKAAVMGGAAITLDQAHQLFELVLPDFITGVKGLLQPTHFDLLDPVRKFVMIDIGYNMGVGEDGFGGFHATLSLLDDAIHTQYVLKQPDVAHGLYGEVADHLEASTWFTQVGDRARRDCAMMRSSEWCDATGNGSDVL